MQAQTPVFQEIVGHPRNSVLPRFHGDFLTVFHKETRQPTTQAAWGGAVLNPQPEGRTRRAVEDSRRRRRQRHWPR